MKKKIYKIISQHKINFIDKMEYEKKILKNAQIQKTTTKNRATTTAFTNCIGHTKNKQTKGPLYFILL